MDFEILGRENIQMERRGTNVLKHENIKYLVVILRGISECEKSKNLPICKH